MSSGVDATRLSDIEQALFDSGVTALEAVLHATLLCMAYQDSRGVFWILRPDNEKVIAGWLAETSFEELRRTVEEHTR